MSQTGQIAAGQAEAVAPAKLVREIFGLEGAAAIAGLSVFAILKWAKPRAAGGCGGCVPHDHQKKYLLAAERLGKSLTGDQLVWTPY